MCQSNYKFRVVHTNQMDNVVTVYHGGIVETDQFSNVTFVGMDRVSLMFDTRPLFSELVARAREELE